MLNLLDESLEAFLRAEVPLPQKSIEMSFEAPDSDWGAGVTKPTLNLYLWDLRLNFDERASGLETREEEGRVVRRRPLPRLDCRYLVTAWTADVRDEHALLGQVMATLLENELLPLEYLQGAYADVSPPPGLEVASPDMKGTSDFWSALGGQLKPGLDLRVTATVDAAKTRVAGPPVEDYELDLQDLLDDGVASRANLFGGDAGVERAGAMVSAPGEVSLVDDLGRWVVRAASRDNVTVPKRKT